MLNILKKTTTIPIITDHLKYLPNKNILLKDKKILNENLFLLGF